MQHHSSSHTVQDGSAQTSRYEGSESPQSSPGTSLAVRALSQQPQARRQPSPSHAHVRSRPLVLWLSKEMRRPMPHLQPHSQGPRNRPRFFIMNFSEVFYTVTAHSILDRKFQWPGSHHHQNEPSRLVPSRSWLCPSLL